MNQWLDILDRLRTRAVGDAEKRAKALNVLNMSKALVSTWIEWDGTGSITYYMHALMWHFPVAILICPSDLWDASGSAIERMNQRNKRLIQ